MPTIIVIDASTTIAPWTSISANAFDEGCKPITITPRCSFTCKSNTEKPTSATCNTWRNAIDLSDNE